jgi:hypothetical protein
MLLHVRADYQTTARYDFLQSVEADRLYAYVDSKGIPTIGVGINLQVHGRLILQTLGFDLSGTQLTGAALAAESWYIAQFLSDFGQPYTPDNTRNNQALSLFNAMLWQRAFDPVYPPPDAFPRPTQFELASSDVSRQVLNQVLDGYNVPGRSSPGYEGLLDTWLTRTGVINAQPGLAGRDSHVPRKVPDTFRRLTGRFPSKRISILQEWRAGGERHETVSVGGGAPRPSTTGPDAPRASAVRARDHGARGGPVQ